jgi:hypothetical protein
MYRHVNISQLSTLRKFLTQIRKYPLLGHSVRELDLSKFSSTFVTQEAGNPLLDILTEAPLIREIRVNKQMGANLNSETVQKLLYGLWYIEVLDLSGCNSSIFLEALSAVICGDLRVAQFLRSLSFAGCSNIPPDIFEALLPRLPRLQYLDASNTQINTAALSSLPSTSKLAHLNISHCYGVNGADFVNFFAQHPSTKGVVFLSIETNPGTEDGLGEGDMTRLLSNLPSSLKVLNLKNSAMTSAHITALQTLSVQLEEINIGADLRFSDVEKLFLDPRSKDLEPDDPEEEETEEMELKYDSVLSPMEQAIAVCKLRQRINSSWQSAASCSQHSHLRYLDISSLSVVEQGKIRTSILMGPQSSPLEIIEISDKVLTKYGVLPKLCEGVGWKLKSMERRCWLKRKEVV